MGGTNYSYHDYSARVRHRAATATPVFTHTADVKAGRAAGVHASLNPLGVKLREARDSAAHPIAVPIAVLLDTTGSMLRVPEIIERRLSELMGHFLNAKASGSRYLGDGYPAILIGGIDDFRAMAGVVRHSEGTLQIGQFESGIEIDNDLEHLWLTGHGGDSYEESYELGLYFMARHTVHDHWEKRGRKGYLFLIGDEHPYASVSSDQVKAVIGDTVQGPISLAAVLDEVRERYHVFFLIPNLTNHYGDPALDRAWVDLLGQQHVIRLDDPEKICEAIVGAVAICEAHIGVDALATDGVASPDLTEALVHLSKSVAAARTADGLPAIGGSAPEVTRL